jgi:hypothetical protein
MLFGIVLVLLYKLNKKGILNERNIKFWTMESFIWNLSWTIGHFNDTFNKYKMDY